MARVRIKHNIWFKDQNGNIIYMHKKDEVVFCHINKEEGIYRTSYGQIEPSDCEILTEGRIS